MLIKTPLVVGVKAPAIIGCSEAAMHLKVAGCPMVVELTPGPQPMIQLYDLSLNRVSFPITIGEAGCYHEGSVEDYHAGKGFYYYWDTDKQVTPSEVEVTNG